MIDGRQTTCEWQKYPGDVCILPVGSVEQHGPHLPIDTDCRGAEFFARLLAEDLGAALLPVLAYANALEHSGFRGTLSLRPETLAQVVRDLADDLERQHFRILILLNGHGGNFILGPVARDINRLDRPLKILLVNWWEIRDASLAPDSAPQGADIHAGEMETSLMLAIAPELVRPRSGDWQPRSGEAFPLGQTDLNAFGAGQLNPEGPLGFPTYATAEKGRAIVAAVRTRLAPFVRDRIERLRRNPHYSGAGGIVLRPLIATDIPACLALDAAAGWERTESEWNLLLNIHPEGCLAAVHNGAVIGAVVALAYGGCMGWIGMLQVQPAFRRQGLGRQLLEAGLTGLQDLPTLKLDAAQAANPFCERLQFKAEYRIERLAGRAPAPASAPPAVQPLDGREIDAAIQLDAEAFGAERAALLRTLLRNGPELAWGLTARGRLSGFCLGRSGPRATRIGPLAAASDADARLLVTAAFQRLAGQPVVLDVPEQHCAFREWLSASGLAPLQHFSRMRRGPNACSGDASRLFATAGPEWG